jgi:hypothetical protein
MIQQKDKSMVQRDRDTFIFIASKEFGPKAITLAVQAHIRHEYTNYDELLMTGLERFEAREVVRNQMEEILNQWKGKRSKN